MTITTSGQTVVRQSQFTLGDPRLQNALNWMNQHNGDKTVTDPSGNTIVVDNFCEEVNEWAYGWFGGTTNGIGFSSAADDYNTQVSLHRIHAESNPNDSTAPAGAMVFFNGDTASGHVGIAVGDGNHYWTTDGYIHEVALTEGLGYKGWSLAPLSWPG